MSVSNIKQTGKMGSLDTSYYFQTKKGVFDPNICLFWTIVDIYNLCVQ